MSTDGVMVLSAAMMKVRVERIVVGKVEMACNKVVYDAMTIGGKGGKSGWLDADAAGDAALAAEDGR